MSGTIILVASLAVGSLLLLVFLAMGERKNRLDVRLNELAGRDGADAAPDGMAELARSALPRMGLPLLPKEGAERTRLKARLVHAGLYTRQAMVVFLGVKMILMVSPVLVGLAVGFVGLVPILYGLIGGMCVGIVGMIGPSFWLDRRKKRRQTAFRRALPDALDVLVICLEGGISLTGAIRRVAGELRTAHPLLASELNIVQREVQLGLSSGQALRGFADRCDLEEIRSLASVIIQTERFGASLVKALRVHAETLRIKRLQRAEELAQMAATKVLIPTVLFILPGLFVVILAPAAIQIMAAFDGMHR
ncbi:MAG TPA: type II secretion system F family protein [Planctomycetales bacterium]|jgi:tight adherence protein C|nr:type II secretion system F family protein [Planctomycetales bacterium]